MAEDELQSVVGTVADRIHGVKRGELIAPESGLVWAAVEGAAGPDAKDVHEGERERFSVGVALCGPRVVEDGLGCVFSDVVHSFHVGKDMLEVGDGRNVIVYLDTA